MPESQIIVRLNPDVPPTGSDLAVVNAARRSFNKRSDWDVVTHRDVYYDFDSNSMKGEVTQELVLKDSDKRLIEFLARGMTTDDFDEFVGDVGDLGYFSVVNNDTGEYEAEHLIDKELVEKLWQWRNTPTHDTPFNHSFISFEVKAPIFVRAQLVKHEYLIMSEFSRRYITDGIEFYTPDYWRKAAPNKKQGSLEEPYDPKETYGHHVDMMGLYLEDLYNINQRYKEFVGEDNDRVAAEQARMMLPQSTMTEWTWSGTLGAFAKMCQLRLHPDAQYESKLVAEQVYGYLKEYWPVSTKALVEGVDV